VRAIPQYGHFAGKDATTLGCIGQWYWAAAAEAAGGGAGAAGAGAGAGATEPFMFIPGMLAAEACVAGICMPAMFMPPIIIPQPPPP
jgi:hypothetical protein